MSLSPAFILFPILLIWLFAFFVYSAASRRDGRAPVDDIGVLFMFVLVLYTTLPPLAWLIQGGSYLIPVGRLYAMQPSTNEVAYLTFIGVAYAIGFATTYLILHKRVSSPLYGWKGGYISKAIMISAAGLFLISKLFLLFLYLSVGGRAESYIDSYRVIAQLPLATRQFLNVLGGFSKIFELVFIVALFQRWPKYKKLLALYVIVSLLSFNPEGARTGILLSLLTIVVLWHMLVRPLSTAKVLFISTLGLVTFLVFGAMRGADSYLGALGAIDYNVLGEFDSIWANAVHLLQESSTEPFNIPLSIYLQEFFAFIPSQLWPIPKMDFTNWYLNSYYPEFKESGGGLGFGAISQAVVGAGIFEALIRGAVLGALSIWALRWVRTLRGPWWQLPLYLSLYLSSYYTVRNSTFILLGGLPSVLPAFLLIFIISKLIKIKPMSVAGSPR